MNEIYTDEDLKLLSYAGWVFIAPDYICIPNDYDGCMAQGHDNIRKIIDGLRERWQNTAELHKKVSEFCKSSTIFAYERCFGLDIEAETNRFVRECIEEFRNKHFFHWGDNEQSIY